jgi:hypothetical protein
MPNLIGRCGDPWWMQCGLEAHFRLILSQMNWNWLREILTCIKFILTQYGFRQTEQALSEHQLTAASFRNLSGLPTFARHHRPGAAHLLPRGFFYIFARSRWVTTAEAAQKRYSNFERVFLPKTVSRGRSRENVSYRFAIVITTSTWRDRRTQICVIFFHVRERHPPW